MRVEILAQDDDHSEEENDESAIFVKLQKHRKISRTGDNGPRDLGREERKESLDEGVRRWWGLPVS